MYLAIDDTYGPKTSGQSRYVTGNRRTHVAVRFQDAEVVHVRTQILCYLEFASNILGKQIQEFHFTDVFNRRRDWAKVENSTNLKIFEFFAEIYRRERWPVMLQTVDDRTIAAEDMKSWQGKLDGLELSDRSNQSLVLLCLRFQHELSGCTEPLTVLVDQGSRKPGAPFGKTLFRDWQGQFRGEFVASSEPLMQVADFVAYCINRSTIIQIKNKRSETDLWFLRLVERMNINTKDLKFHALPPDFSVQQIDDLHHQDRVAKGLERLSPDDPKSM